MSLLRLGTFAAHSGQSLTWKIECDALTDDDWTAIAALAIRMMGGIFSGGGRSPRGHEAGRGHPAYLKAIARL